MPINSSIARLREIIIKKDSIQKKALEPEQQQQTQQAYKRIKEIEENILERASDFNERHMKNGANWEGMG